MQTAFKGVFAALLVLFVAQAAAQDVPYSTSWTTTGDASSTTFVLTVCNTASASAETNRPLKSLSISASGVTTWPESTPTSGGVSFSGASLGSLATQSPSDPEHCEAFYLTAPTAGAKIESISGGSPTVSLSWELDNGVTATTTSGPESSGPATTPSGPSTPSNPQVYGRRRSLLQAGPTPYGRRL